MVERLACLKLRQIKIVHKSAVNEGKYKVVSSHGMNMAQRVNTGTAPHMLNLGTT
jgi:hypothetical protein